MTGNRLLYAIIYILAFVFNFYYDGALSWYILIFFTVLPIGSFLISLPAMLMCKLSFEAPTQVAMNSDASVRIKLSRQFVVPCGAVSFRLSSENLLNGTRSKNRRVRLFGFHENDMELVLPTEHCGSVRVRADRVRACDLMGLWSLPKRAPMDATICVMPKPDPNAKLPEGITAMLGRRKPKPGGGYSEEHELRPYRQGDSVRSIHWKLTSKMDDIIVREPMVAVTSRILVTLLLYGEPKQLDDIMGALLRLADKLLSSDMPFILRTPTIKGERFAGRYISNQSALIDYIQALMGQRAPSAITDDIAPPSSHADRHFILKPEDSGAETL